MNRDKNIQNELDQLSRLLKEITSSNPYSAPDGYFESFSDRMSSLIHSHSDVISSLEEIEQSSPLLAGLQKRETYKIKDGYFEQNADMLTQKVSHKDAKLIDMRTTRFIKSLSVAAAFIGLVGIIIFITLNKSANTGIVNTQPEIKTEKEINYELAGIKTDDIIRYLNEYALPYDRTEMENYLDPHTLPDEASYFDETVLNELL
jgi:hypothetical protein